MAPNSATMMTYIHLVADESTETLRPVLRDVGSDAEEAYVTLAEKSEARGRAAALLQLLDLRFGPVPAAAADAVRAAPVEQVETWTAQVLTATTLEDALR